ncbi:MAG: hypothetical protein HY010_17800 [Acidobacteria bacterium]|nr:hypothetical protein [Acidobacteriota bacterium]
MLMGLNNSKTCASVGYPNDQAVTRGEMGKRRLELRVEMLGAYQDRVLVFQYSNVVALDLGVKGAERSDYLEWVCDEFDLVGRRLISHEIQWHDGSLWRMVADNATLLVPDKR